MAEELTAREELMELAEALREADESEKQWKKLKEEVRGPFFELISEVIREEIPLATFVETVPNDGADIEIWRQKNYPEYRIIGMNPDGEDLTLTLQENESLKKYEFELGGYRFGRQIRYEGRGFDAAAFHEFISDWDRGDLSDEAWEALRKVVSREEIITYEVDEAKANKVMADYPETVAIFQEYMLPGTPKPALLPIRPVKEEEPDE